MAKVVAEEVVVVVAAEEVGAEVEEMETVVEMVGGQVHEALQ